MNLVFDENSIETIKNKYARCISKIEKYLRDDLEQFENFNYIRMKYAYDFFEFNVDSYILYLENLEDTTRSVEINGLALVLFVDVLSLLFFNEFKDNYMIPQFWTITEILRNKKFDLISKGTHEYMIFMNSEIH
jgi:hypothetical protein